MRLLILDDDPHIGMMIRLVAESAGIQARYVTETAAFFLAVDEWSPDYIAVDLIMPEMDGVEVLIKLAERGCDAKLIITSGVDSRVLDAARRSAVEHGLEIAGVLSKPFSPRDLRSLLHVAPAGRAEAVKPAAANAGAQPVKDTFELTEAELRRAVYAGEFQLYYQPQIECSSGRLAGFEALLRWIHPQQGIIMPMRFIPLAERFCLIDELTDQVLAQAMHWFMPRFAASEISISVNLSAKSMNASAAPAGTAAAAPLVERITALCRKQRLDPSRLILELTETSAMEDPTRSLDLLTRLRVKGFQLSIDDFGTGYSSMLQLARLPFSEIKVDKSFVGTAIRSIESGVVVKSIVDLGHSLGLRVVAEGAEDLETLKFLQGIGCDLAQGYAIARPMHGDAVPAWIEESASKWRTDATQPLLL